MAQKRPMTDHHRNKRRNKKSKPNGPVSEGSNDEVLLHDLRNLLRQTRLSEPQRAPVAESEEKTAELQEGEVELEIQELSSTGDGIALKDGKLYVVPFVAPGDKVIGKVYRHVAEVSVNRDGPGYAVADFVRVVQPSSLRTEEPKCPYFTRCSGCQFQHLSYATQLEHKKRIVERAYTNFSGLSPELVPTVGDTIGSPLQFGYRTKLTPHFDGPPQGRGARRRGEVISWPAVPPIGFMLKGTRKTLDIEDCPIGTEVVRLGMKRERERVVRELEKYKKGATLLLRESTEKVEKKHEGGASEQHGGEDVVEEDRGDHVHLKRCITDNNAISTEYVDDFRFDNPAGAFFQNNNSILPLVTAYIRENILGPTSASSDSTTPRPKMHNLIDAYCGSGFFTITLSSIFTQSIGIDISGASIASATTNARLNKLPSESTRFIAADANALFASLETQPPTPSTSTSPSSEPSVPHFAPDETVVVIDPPRKGCDENFIRQLLAFGPARICYVSCNVHTQARDVGLMVKDRIDGEGKSVPGLYEIESLRGFDFFPQTGHVEGVAMLRRRGSGVDGGDGVGEAVL